MAIFMRKWNFWKQNLKSLKRNEVYCNLDKHFLLSVSQLCLQTSFFDRNWDFYEIWDFMKSHFVRKWHEFDLLRKYYVIKHVFVFSRTFLNFHERSFKFIKSSDSVRLDDYGNNNVKLHQKFPNYFRGNAFQIHEYSRLS